MVKKKPATISGDGHGCLVFHRVGRLDIALSQFFLLILPVTGCSMIRPQIVNYGDTPHQHDELESAEKVRADTDQNEFLPEAGWLQHHVHHEVNPGRAQHHECAARNPEDNTKH